jgi:hypothetical protein
VARIECGSEPAKNINKTLRRATLFLWHFNQI